MNKRFLIFMWIKGYAQGGFRDYECYADTLEEVKERIKSIQRDNELKTQVQVFDTEEGQIVYTEK